MQMTTKNSNSLIAISIFISGAALLSLQLASSRLIAPYYGDSIYVWTSVIGIVLGSISLGSFAGGFLADKLLSIKIYSHLFLIAATLGILTAIIGEPVTKLIFELTKDQRLGSILILIILFAPACTSIGMITPYAIRLAIKTIEESGRISGKFFAISTAGSISGTFLYGFFLSQYLSTNKSIAAVSISLLICALVLRLKFRQ